MRALLVFGSNMAVSAPRAGHIQKRLDALDFLAVSDFFLSETAERADVVLPSAQWAEEEGTMTNLEGRVILRQRATEPPAGVRTDIEILSGLADRMGYGRFFPSQAAKSSRNCDARRRAGRPIIPASPGTGSGVRTESSGRARRRPSGHAASFLERFGTEDGRARFHPIAFQASNGRARRRISTLSDHRPGHGPVSIGNANPTSRGAGERGARGFRTDSSFDGANVRNRGGRPGQSDHAARVQRR